MARGGILFEASSSVMGLGLYVWRDGVITRVISRFETLNGMPIFGFGLSTEAIEGDMIAFSILGPWGPSPQSALYTATYVPAPGPIGLVLVAGLSGACRRRRR